MIDNAEAQVFFDNLFRHYANKVALKNVCKECGCAPLSDAGAKVALMIFQQNDFQGITKPKAANVFNLGDHPFPTPDSETA